ncbi:MAG: glucosaminidase domain-containing protein [Bacteroidia bacterium]|nr:glucosaminidase domain-containing protein [Bacteroidia bacterium]
MITETFYRIQQLPSAVGKKSNPLLISAISFVAFLFIYFVSISQAIAKYKTVDAYVTHFAPLAKKLSLSTGIPASIILGISIIESGHGNSKNCKLLKNHFGIVGKNYLSGRKSKYRSMYKSYLNDEASFRHFCRVIKSKRYYALLKGNTNYTYWLKKINSGHYSSAKKVWIRRIYIAIRTHQLYKFDMSKRHLATK